MDVLDGDLDIVHDSRNQACRETLVLLLLLGTHALGISLFQQLSAVQLLHLDRVCPALLLISIVVSILLGGGQQINILNVDLQGLSP